MRDGKLHLDHIALGVCYYPEHWPEEIWEDDICRMKESGIEVVRIAEFAWNKFEPEEGVYTFDFFDRFMELTVKYGMKVIFCTPTATPPLWLSERYPEILNADMDGNRYYHGLRRHNNLTSPIYRAFSERITEKLADHYVAHPQVIGWQLDNEINCENDCYYAESDHQAFRKYCRGKFGSLEEFNKRMGTVFWNQTYTDWNQLYLTRRTNACGNTNPHIQLEEKRFISDTACSFFSLQAEVIRKYQRQYGREEQFITTNGVFRHIDYPKLVEQALDFITFDNYPAFAFENALDPEQTNGLRDRNSSRNLTRIRSISPVFGIMEQQTGAGGWNCRMKMPMPVPGQLRLWTMQAIAHGADYIGYFRWRTAVFGTEIYWHGLLDYDSRENRRLRELKETAGEVKKLESLAGSEYVAEVAVLLDYDSEWDGETDIWHGEMRERSLDAWFVSLQKEHIPFDYLYLTDDTAPEKLAGYRYLIYPHATIFTERRKELLAEAVRQGAVLLFGCRTGYKDGYGQCYTMPMPGYAAELCGCYVEEYTSVSEFLEPVEIRMTGEEAPAVTFHDILDPVDGEVMGTFEGTGCHYAGRPAVVRKPLGKGFGWYVGSGFSEDLARMLIRQLGMRSCMPYRDVLTLPETVELALRRKDGETVLFLLNYGKEEVEIGLHGGDKIRFRDIFTDAVRDGTLYLQGIDVCLLRVEENQGMNA